MNERINKQINESMNERMNITSFLLTARVSSSHLRIVVVLQDVELAIIPIASRRAVVVVGSLVEEVVILYAVEPRLPHRELVTGVQGSVARHAEKTGNVVEAMVGPHDHFFLRYGSVTFRAARCKQSGKKKKRKLTYPSSSSVNQVIENKLPCPIRFLMRYTEQ